MPQTTQPREPPQHALAASGEQAFGARFARTLNPETAAAPGLRRGRGAITNEAGRYEALARVAFEDGWATNDDPPPLATEVTEERARKIITTNDSPDLGFDRSINPYRGCEHGCAYCFARPTHAYMGLSPGLDFETKLFAKPNAAELLKKELSAPGYEPKTIALGTNTDPYQPIEKRREITRRILETLEAASHPVAIVTKGHLVTRDVDILARMAVRGLAKVAVSVTTLDRGLARSLEPRAASPERRLDAIRALSSAGVPVAVMVAPVIPAVNDWEIERILDAARAQGASEAGYVLLRLPLEVRDLFRQWLVANKPDAARHALSLIRQSRGGKDYDATFGRRMTGEGPYAWMIGRRFEAAMNRLGYEKRRLKLRVDLFTPPDVAAAKKSVQLSMF